MLCNIFYIFIIHVGCGYGEIIESSGEPRHLSTISLKNFYLFKIAESIINLCLKKFYNNNFKHVEDF